MGFPMNFQGSQALVLLLLICLPATIFLGIIVGFLFEMLKVKINFLKAFAHKNKRLIIIFITFYLLTTFVIRFQNSTLDLLIVDVLIFPLSIVITILGFVAGVKVGRLIMKLFQKPIH